MNAHARTPEEFRTVWEAKPTLRAVYGEYYRRIQAWITPGRTIEIGSGAGNLKCVIAGAFATDIVPSPWLDVVLDAQRLPVLDGSVTNLIGIDVLHHIEYPRLFLLEAQRVLVPGGRVVFVEPAVTPLSWVAFKLMHPEPVDLRADPFAEGSPRLGRDPFAANQALPTLMVGRHRDRWQRELPALRLVHREWLSIVAYPLSGGFRSWCLLPGKCAPAVLRAEDRLPSWMRRLLGFRLLLVAERT